jgi:diaminohydroxyphosphoribosylaminopyrimidine deaminase/5-amino-6-(5-phosphoribosylamino)uracil reductase
MDLMFDALTLAESALFVSNPNPRVGCVLVSASGEVIGRGATEAAGKAHAEVVALRQASAQGASTEGATAFVTLEPCSHHGRTPPCCDALIAAGVARVVVATLDPNPVVAGNGIARLRDAGISVEVLAHDSTASQAARTLNIGFFSRMIRKRPWVRLKLAASLDGKTALPDGQSQWITSKEARADGHAWRARACRVLSGVGTVLADDPMLDVRAVVTPRQPHLVVVDSRLRTPTSARMFQASEQGSERTVTLVHGAKAAPATAATLEAAGARLLSMPSPQDQVDLEALIHWLGTEGETNELHVEAGPTLSGALLSAGLVDELLLYQAPLILGPGLPLVDLPVLPSLSDAQRLDVQDLQSVGPDIRLLARFPGSDAFLTAN